MRISDWSSDVCSSDLDADAFVAAAEKELFDFSVFNARVQWINNTYITEDSDAVAARVGAEGTEMSVRLAKEAARFDKTPGLSFDTRRKLGILKQGIVLPAPSTPGARSEEHTSELQSLMRISYAVFCLKKKKNQVQ